MSKNLEIFSVIRCLAGVKLECKLCGARLVTSGIAVVTEKSLKLFDEMEKRRRREIRARRESDLSKLAIYISCSYYVFIKIACWMMRACLIGECVYAQNVPFVSCSWDTCIAARLPTDH